MAPEPAAGASLSRRGSGWLGTFQSMASPCEVHVGEADLATADRVVAIAAAEARRIEAKFSRYLRGNVIDAINTAEGRPVVVDDETARLLDYAARLHELSDGKFDVTSGVLRRAWRFDGSDRVPTPEAVAALLPIVGWDKVRWRAPELRLPRGMEIDLGGIGKEYAVDSAAGLVRSVSSRCLLNFGGDLLALGPQPGGSPWRVGVESVSDVGAVAKQIDLTVGALATSGDSRRFLQRDGKRYGHVLDPRTGWPVAGGPRSVTVAASTCTEAGMLATLALLQGADAEAFLEAQGVQFWALR
ncbi:MAG TPA: FAD:protein FMN transferase [Gammaproteobacteria bacterium]|nr:FAD:protein FMN transferase [Gammaproteobacteria bacterium]